MYLYRSVVQQQKRVFAMITDANTAGISVEAQLQRAIGA